MTIAKTKPLTMVPKTVSKGFTWYLQMLLEIPKGGL